MDEKEKPEVNYYPCPQCTFMEKVTREINLTEHPQVPCDACLEEWDKEDIENLLEELNLFDEEESPYRNKL